MSPRSSHDDSTALQKRVVRACTKLPGAELICSYGEDLRTPGVAYLAIISGGFVALAIIGSWLALLEPLARPENSRLESLRHLD